MHARAKGAIIGQRGQISLEACCISLTNILRAHAHAHKHTHTRMQTATTAAGWRSVVCVRA